MNCPLKRIVKDHSEFYRTYIQVVHCDIDPATHVAVRGSNFSNGNEADYHYVSELGEMVEEHVKWYFDLAEFATGEYVSFNDGSTITAYCLVINQ